MADFQPDSGDFQPPRKVSIGEDMARGGAAGLAQGALAIPGTFGDVPVTIDKALDWLVGMVPGGKDFVKATQQQREAVHYKPNLTPTTSQMIQGAAQAVPEVGYQPQTIPGQYARTVGQFAPNAVAPGGPVTKALSVLVPALTSETAGQITRKVSPKNEAAARLLGAVVGGVGAGALSNQLKGSTRTMANATEDVTDAQLADAVALAKKGQAVGVPLTSAEAFKTAAPQTRLDQALRDVEGSEQGSQLRAMFGERPQAVQAAGGRMLDAVAPPGNPVLIGQRGQTAAQNALGDLEAQRSATVNPAYQAAGPQTVPQSDIEDLVQAVRTQAAGDKTGLLRPTLEKFAERFTPEGSSAPITDIENLDRIRKFYRDKMVLPPGSADALPKEVSGSISPYLQRLGQMMETASPDFARGKSVYQQLSRDVVGPAEAGPLGPMGQTSSVGTQTGALFPNQPPEGQPGVTVEALQRLAGQDQGLPADLVRQHLARALAEQTQNNMTGPNQWGGSKFAANVAGNPTQAETLAKGLETANPSAAPLTQDTLDVFSATGRRLPPGSSTAERLQAAEDVKAGESVGIAGVAHASPRMLLDRVARWAQDVTQAGNRKRLADFFLADPDNYQSLVRHAQQEYAAGRMSQRVMRAVVLNAEAAKVHQPEGAQ